MATEEVRQFFQQKAAATLVSPEVEAALASPTGGSWGAGQSSIRPAFLQFLDLVGALSQEVRTNFQKKGATVDYIVTNAERLVRAQKPLDERPTYVSCEQESLWPRNLEWVDEYTHLVSFDDICIKSNTQTQKKIEAGQDPRLNADLKVLMDLDQHFKINHASLPDMFWQYLGTTDYGLLANWPGLAPWATNCKFGTHTHTHTPAA
jgi:hypothetical protein